MHKHQEVIRERKKREKDQRIEGILRAAEKIFFSKGYQRTTMDEIAYEAQISKPTIYQYFKTKDDLYSALMLPFLEEFGAHFERIEKKLDTRRYTTGKSLVNDLFKAFLKSHEAAPESLRVAKAFFQHADLISALNPETRMVISSRGKYDFEIARGIMKKAIEQGLIKKISPYALSDIIWGMLLGISQVMDMKAMGHTDASKYLKTTLAEAQKIITAAIVMS